jgi:hypothetical protein
MDIQLVRKWFTTKSTIGEIYVNGIYQCLVLEDRDRGLRQEYEKEEAYKGMNDQLKVPGKTAIPYGKYEVVVTFSQRFQKQLPLLLNIPVFSGVRIHPGNFPENTEGCLLPGTTRRDDAVFNSKEAFNALFVLIQKACKQEKVYLTISKEEKKKQPGLSEDFHKVNEYIAQLEQLLIFFADELEEIPNSGLSDGLLEVLDRLKGVIVDGQILRDNFARRLRNEDRK